MQAENERINEENRLKVDELMEGMKECDNRKEMVGGKVVDAAYDLDEVLLELKVGV